MSLFEDIQTAAERTDIHNLPALADAALDVIVAVADEGDAEGLPAYVANAIRELAEVLAENHPASEASS